MTISGYIGTLMALTVMRQVIVSALGGSQGEARSRTCFQWDISKGIALLVKVSQPRENPGVCLP